MRRRLLAALTVLAACSETAVPVDTATQGSVADASEVGPAPDSAGPAEEVAALDALPEGEVDVVSSPEPVPATDYCERAVDVFCPYYLRCGRMAVVDLPSCEAAFIETCNARYEPIYADLATRGALTLSAAGLAACEAHLATVACEAQLGDLDGPCGEIWLGQSPVGAPCGPGIESLVCDADSVCRLGLDFCGQCVAVTYPGGGCEYDLRCRSDAVCVDGACVPRVQTGEPCTAADTCEVGAGCVGPEGAARCLGPTIVALGEDCGAGVRCPYKSVCSGGTCVATGLLGEPCEPAIGCASGTCQGGVCEPLGGPGAPCVSGLDCRSGKCGGAKTCQAVGPSCP